jgi:hypothetical protein
MLSESRNLLMEQIFREMVTPFARQIRQKVRRHYPRPCVVSITLFWARNLLYDVNSDEGWGSKVYLDKRGVFVVFFSIILVFSLWSRAAREAARTHFAKLDKSI